MFLQPTRKPKRPIALEQHAPYGLSPRRYTTLLTMNASTIENLCAQGTFVLCFKAQVLPWHYVERSELPNSSSTQHCEPGHSNSHLLKSHLSGKGFLFKKHTAGATRRVGKRRNDIPGHDPSSHCPLPSTDSA